MSKEELTDPRFWANVAHKFQMGSEIRITDLDCSFMARAFVTYASQHDVRLHIIEYHVFETASDTVDNEYYVKQRGVHKWCIMKQGNSDSIQSGIATKHEAEKQLDEYLKTLAR
ncbi:hypothetical protein OAO65_02275 [Flavobacteriales bacterium]|nr:hypothetical protein [Flavobacteriales bacterium]